MLNTPIPQELVDISKQYADKQHNLLKLTWESDEALRSFSPLAKGFLGNKVILANQQFIPQEKEFIKLFAKLLISQYGDPVFTYTGYNDTIPAVKQFQALQRFSPKVTPGASQRRFDNLMKYFTPKTFNPDPVIWSKTVEKVRRILNLPQVNITYEPKYVRGLFAAHASNVGYPYYTNELTKDKTGKPYRDLTVDLSKQLLSKYKSAAWICSIPTVIIGRDQPGGNTLDLTRIYTREQLLSALDKIKYKPSKARPIWAIARIVNNLVTPLVKSLIEHPQFKSNPIFCGFLSREARCIQLGRYDKLAKELKLLPVNIDFDGFDASVSAELLLTALDLLFETVSFKNEVPEDLLDAIKASSIFTKAVALDPYTKDIFRQTKEACIASGHGTTGLSGFICALLVMVYAMIVYYGEQWVDSLITAAANAKTGFSFGLGDDFQGMIKKLSDLVEINKIINKAFGMNISVDSIKTAVGVDFLQELYWNGNIEYPIGRLAPSALYTERSSGKGFALWDMSFASMIYNIRTNSEQQILGVTSIFQSLDKTDLGLRNLEGKKITSTQFMEYLKRECSLRERTPKQLLWDGDPSKESRYANNGELKSDYLNWWFSLISRCIDSNGEFSTKSLRAIWTQFK